MIGRVNKSDNQSE